MNNESFNQNEINNNNINNYPYIVCKHIRKDEDGFCPDCGYFDYSKERLYNAFSILCIVLSIPFCIGSLSLIAFPFVIFFVASGVVVDELIIGFISLFFAIIFIVLAKVLRTKRYEIIERVLKKIQYKENLLVKCKYCGADMDLTAKVCSYCGRKSDEKS